MVALKAKAARAKVDNAFGFCSNKRTELHISWLKLSFCSQRFLQFCYHGGGRNDALAMPRDLNSSCAASDFHQRSY